MSVAIPIWKHDGVTFQPILMVPLVDGARKPADFEYYFSDGTRFTPDYDKMYSKSKIERFLSCERKYAFSYLAGIKEPESAAAAAGVSQHAELEAWLKHGVPPSSRNFINSGVLKEFPMPHTIDMGVERPFAFMISVGSSYAVFWGFKDVELPGVVIDLKTKGDLTWAMTESQLRDDLQAAIYAIDNYLVYGKKHVALKWVFHSRKTAQFVIPGGSTGVVVNVEDLVDKVALAFVATQAMEKITQRVSKTEFAANPLRVIELPATTAACGEYGGCFYKDKCTDLTVAKRLFVKRVTPADKETQLGIALTGLVKQATKLESLGHNLGEDMGILDRVKAAAASAQQHPVATGTPAVTVAPAAPVATAPVVTAPVAAVTPVAPAAPASAQAKANRFLNRAPAATAVVTAGAVVVPTAPVVAAPVVAAPEEEVEETEAKKRGRKPGSVNKKLNGFILCIDCVPTKSNGTVLGNIEDIIGASRNAVEAEAGQHYRLVEGFKTGIYAWAALLDQALMAEAPTGLYYVPRNTLEPEVLEVLLRHATYVFQRA